MKVGLERDGKTGFSDAHRNFHKNRLHLVYAVVKFIPDHGGGSVSYLRVVRSLCNIPNVAVYHSKMKETLNGYAVVLSYLLKLEPLF